MRITNTMMTNNTMRNVNKSKNTLYTAEEQMSSQKRISKPSDDPIIAIRALSLRTSLSEVTQYLKKNVPDAESWIKLTETSLDNVNRYLSDIYEYCNQGSSDSFTTTNRQALMQSINQLKDSIYSEGNADYSGRYIFTGYRTDDSLTFKNEIESNVKYRINQEFSISDINTVKYMKNSVDANVTAATANTIASADMPQTEEVYRMRLAYNTCSKDATPTISLNGTPYTGNVVKLSNKEFEKLISKNGAGMNDGTIYYIHDNGELVFNKKTNQNIVNNYQTAVAADPDTKWGIKVTYQKDDFKKGDVKPEHYFECEDLTNNVKYLLGDNQDIEYTINFSQTLKVNARAKDAISFNIGRDIDDLLNSLDNVYNIENKIEKLKQMKESTEFKNKQDEIESMITAANKELDYAKNYMEGLFAKGMTQMKNYQSVLNSEIADIGSREVRLTLAKSRLTEQESTFKDLKSKNEDLELEEIAINFAAAETVYNAAISTAAKSVRQTLLDYI